jgi:hypothetical protein
MVYRTTHQMEGERSDRMTDVWTVPASDLAHVPSITREDEGGRTAFQTSGESGH